MKTIINPAKWFKNRVFANLFFLALIFIFPAADSQIRTSKARWQADLNYLQKKIHNEYAHLFYNITTGQFDSAVARLRSKIPSLIENQIKAEFFRLLALFQIGHTGIRFKYGKDPDGLKPMFHYYPLTVYPFSDGLYIKSIDEKYKSALGGRIIKVGDLRTDDALKKLHEVIPCENEQYFKSNLSYFFCLPELLQALKITATGRSVLLTYIKEGREDKIELPAGPYPAQSWHAEPYLPPGWVDAYPGFDTKESVSWLKHPHSERYFEYLKESKTLYVRHSTIEDEAGETIETFFKKVFDFAGSNEVNKFILDLRLNGGGNNYLNRPVITGIIRSKEINRYGHLFVITGAATFSAAQNLVNELEKYTEVIFVGEPTAENVNYWGDVKTEVLPNSQLNIVLSCLWWQNMDPRDKRQWTAPHLAAAMSFDNYRAGYDSAMNIILGFKDEQPAEERVKHLIARGSAEEAMSILKQYMENPLHRYYKTLMQEKINDMAYSFLMREELDEANSLFYMNTVFFPRSANAYDGYAESFYKMGRIKDAVRYYEMAASLAPAGDISDNARKMLAILKKKQEVK